MFRLWQDAGVTNLQEGALILKITAFPRARPISSLDWVSHRGVKWDRCSCLATRTTRWFCAIKCWNLLKGAGKEVCASCGGGRKRRLKYQPQRYNGHQDPNKTVQWCGSLKSADLVGLSLAFMTSVSQNKLLSSCGTHVQRFFFFFFTVVVARIHPRLI